MGAQTINIDAMPSRRETTAGKGQSKKTVHNDGSHIHEAEEELIDNEDSQSDQHVKWPKLFWNLSKSSDTIPALPGLVELPDDQPNEDIQAQLVDKECSKWGYGMNYGYLAMNKIANSEGQAFRRDWWDFAPDALTFKTLQPREATNEDAKLVGKWVGKKYQNMTLYYKLGGDPRFDEIGEVLGLSKLEHVPLYINMLGKFPSFSAMQLT